jgi:hypothetical protein
LAAGGFGSPGHVCARFAATIQKVVEVHVWKSASGDAGGKVFAERLRGTGLLRVRKRADFLEYDGMGGVREKAGRQCRAQPGAERWRERDIAKKPEKMPFGGLAITVHGLTAAEKRG